MNFAVGSLARDRVCFPGCGLFRCNLRHSDLGAGEAEMIALALKNPVLFR